MSVRNIGRRSIAFLYLLAADGVMRFSDFNTLCSLVRRFPLRSTGRGVDINERRRGLCVEIHRASNLYFHRVLCLQLSAAATCLLRWRGIPAEMVIAVQKMPFRAHAWVECDGEVVTDRSEVQRNFVVIERC